MDPYVAYTAFFTRVTVRLMESSKAVTLPQMVELELTELRLRDQRAWMELYGYLGQITTSPTVGTVGQQAQASKALQEYLVDRVKTTRPELILPAIAEAYRHYNANQDELLEAIEEFTLDGASDEAIVEFSLKNLKPRTSS